MPSEYDLGLPMRSRCLILDHDDTAEDSTREIHYPAHVRAMQQLRPEHRPVSVEEWFVKNCEPGIMGYLVDELGMSEEELETSFRVWREATAEAIPHFYPGVLEALAAYRAEGGLIVVASHSEEHVIRAHYQAAGNGRALMPDLVFGWAAGPDRRKPHPFPVEETLRQLDLEPRDVLVVDDLKPGIEMAGAAGVDAAAVAWSHDLSVIRAYMDRRSVARFDTVSEFAEFILR